MPPQGLCTQQASPGPEEGAAMRSHSVPSPATLTASPHPWRPRLVSATRLGFDLTQ